MDTHKASQPLTPMINFKLLSNKFDEEKMIKPSKAGRRAVTIYRRYDAQIKKLDKLGVDKSKNEQIESFLSDLLYDTQDMTEKAAQKRYDVFIKDTEKRIDSVVYRLKHINNLGRKLNAIDRQSKLTHKTFEEQKKA